MKRTDGAAVVAALIAPLAVTLVLVPFRDEIANTDAALVVVLVVVAVAATGRRTAGILAALGAGVWFDFFFTRPYERFTINSRTDVETTVLLLLVGIGVTELAGWGRRQQALASREAGYLAGIHAAAESVATGDSPTALAGQICDQLTRIFRLRRCDFDYGTGVVGGDRPRLRHDGSLEWRGTVRDVEKDGLPVEQETELLVSTSSGYRGRFLLTATHDSRPSLAQRLVAIALADQLGAALDEHRPAP
jgi:Domain of unknown function (DUF4118)